MSELTLVLILLMTMSLRDCQCRCGVDLRFHPRGTRGDRTFCVVPIGPRAARTTCHSLERSAGGKGKIPQQGAHDRPTCHSGAGASFLTSVFTTASLFVTRVNSVTARGEAQPQCGTRP